MGVLGKYPNPTPTPERPMLANTNFEGVLGLGVTRRSRLYSKCAIYTYAPEHITSLTFTK